MACYLLACLGLIVGGGYFFQNSGIALKGYEGLRWAVEALVIGYLARGSYAPKENGAAKLEEPKPEPKP